MTDISTKTASALAMLGAVMADPADAHHALAPDPSAHAAHVRAVMRDAAARLAGVFRGGMIAALTGPSGSGKTTLLSELSRVRPHHERAPVIHCKAMLRRALGRGSNLRPADLMDTDTPACLRTLALVGLADAPAVATPVRALSVGQKSRLAIALGMDHARRSLAQLTRDRGPREDSPVSVREENPAGGPVVTVVIDELCSGLDEVTGESVARAIRRWVDSSSGGVRVVAACARRDVAEWLDPDVRVRIGPGAQGTRVRIAVRPPPPTGTSGAGQTWPGDGGGGVGGGGVWLRAAARSRAFLRAGAWNCAEPRAGARNCAVVRSENP